MIIFAPNRMFLDYISGVLPELGVGDIVADDVRGLGDRAAGERGYASLPGGDAGVLVRAGAYARGVGNRIRLLKGSTAFKDALNIKLNELEESLVPVERLSRCRTTRSGRR